MKSKHFTAFFFVFASIIAFLSISFAQEKNTTGHDNNIEIRNKVIAFVGSLAELQKHKVFFDLNDTMRTTVDRVTWGLRKGLSLGDLTDVQRKLLHRILSASLSSQGYLKVTGIMHLENLEGMHRDSLYNKKTIKEKENDQSHWHYYVSVFGNPASDSVWSFKMEGHHLSLNLNFINHHFAVTPMFLGAGPAEYYNTEYAGWRLLGQEEDLGLTLVNLLSPQQKEKAVLGKQHRRPPSPVTPGKCPQRLTDSLGIKGSELNDIQSELLECIVKEYTSNLELAKANEEYNKIMEAGIEDIYFGWSGSYKENGKYFFVLDGPTFRIEYGNGNNHIHSIWWERGNEFGDAILK